MIILKNREEILSKASTLLSDESRFTLGVPKAVYFPETENELQDLMKRLHNDKTPITFSGAGTGITGGAVPTNDCALISFTKLNRIKKFFTKANYAYLECEAGVTLSEIETFLKSPDNYIYPVENSDKVSANKLFYAPDPTEMTAQIGGTIITNASGARSFKYGATRSSVKSLTIILANGSKLILDREKHYSDLTTDSGESILFKFPGYQSPNIKNAAGYFSSSKMHPIDLFIGSEGTLGAISNVIIKLHEKKDLTAGLSFFPDHKKAFLFAEFLRNKNDVVAIEYFDETTLPFIKKNRDRLVHKLPEFPENKNCAIYWEYSDNEPFINKSQEWKNELIKNGSSLKQTWSGFTQKEKVLLKQFRHSVPEIVNTLIGINKKSNPNIRKISSDTSVPPHNFIKLYNYYTKILKSEELTFVVFGHLGDYHLHFNIIPQNEQELKKALFTYKRMMKKAIELEGTVSAEHGIGKLKKEYLKKMYGEEAILEMKKIKSIFDPENRLNPENLF